MTKRDIGLIGLAVMGENLALNLESKGFSVAVYNRTADKTRSFMAGKAAGKAISGAGSIRELTDALASPRRIIMMVKAGPPVDLLIEQLTPHLSAGDILMDGGNSFFQDTNRRNRSLETAGIRYLGVGISGGEEGALHGPSIMPGGPADAYDLVAPVLTRIAAQVDDGPCCTYIGPQGAGHFVKMVHNGIEYGDMQLIAEAYDILRTALGLEAAELADIFARWNTGPLSSYLIEITAAIFGKKDGDTGNPLVDMILDKAGQKGTGVWTSKTAFDLGVAIPTINAAVEARILSAYKQERRKASQILATADRRYEGDKQRLVNAVHDALYASKICSYAQGMALIKAASQEYDWEMNLAEISRIWKGGCIIRADLLENIMAAFDRNPDLPSLLMDSELGRRVVERREDLATVSCAAAATGIPAPGLMVSLAYFDAFRSARLPANLIQAQRDFFGAHTYARVDAEGHFHTDWEN